MISVVEARTDEDVSAAKRIADRFRRELGFHTAQAFRESGNRGELLIVLDGSDPIGFVRFHHRRDHRTTLYEIASILQGWLTAHRDVYYTLPRGRKRRDPTQVSDRASCKSIL
jgi:hypothetical protein